MIKGQLRDDLRPRGGNGVKRLVDDVVALARHPADHLCIRGHEQITNFDKLISVSKRTLRMVKAFSRIASLRSSSEYTICWISCVERLDSVSQLAWTDNGMIDEPPAEP
jgi:hypothetical protein